MIVCFQRRGEPDYKSTKFTHFSIANSRSMRVRTAAVVIREGQRECTADEKKRSRATSLGRRIRREQQHEKRKKINGRNECNRSIRSPAWEGSLLLDLQLLLCPCVV